MLSVILGRVKSQIKTKKTTTTTTTPFLLAQSLFFGNSKLSCVKVYLTFSCSLSFLYIYLPMHLF